MIHNDVKKAAESGNISLLKYFFCDCLDGDPTFAEYAEDYEYCKSMGILFESHTELHPMILDTIDEVYWVQLKKDFMQNPSIERMEHMREVAKILYSARIHKIEEDHAREAASKSNIQQLSELKKPANTVQEVSKSARQANSDSVHKVSDIKITGQTNSVGVRRVSEPIGQKKTVGQTNSVGVRRVSERVDNTHRTNESKSTDHISQGTQQKKDNGVSRRVATIITIAIMVIVIICLINKM